MCFKVAGRLHVEVLRVGGGLEDSIAGGDDPDNNQDNEIIDIQDRKLVCMVGYVYYFLCLFFRNVRVLSITALDLISVFLYRLRSCRPLVFLSTCPTLSSASTPSGTSPSLSL